MSIEEKTNQPSFEETSSVQETGGRLDLSGSLERLRWLIQSSSQVEEGELQDTDQNIQKTINYLDGLIDKAKQGFFSQRSIPQEDNPSLKILTKREREILRLIANGLANKNIASKLGISIRTVEVHRSNLTHKLGIKSTAGLVKYAISQGLV